MTKLIDLVRRNKKDRERKEIERMNNAVDVKWTSRTSRGNEGMYIVTIPFLDYEIVVETPSLKDSDMVPSVSVFFKGMEVTDTFVDTKVGRNIFASGINLARIMALILKKEQEEA